MQYLKQVDSLETLRTGVTKNFLVRQVRTIKFIHMLGKCTLSISLVREYAVLELIDN